MNTTTSCGKYTSYQKKKFNVSVLSVLVSHTSSNQAQMPCVACTEIERIGGRVFGRDQSGAYAIQLDGFPGVIRMYPKVSDDDIRNSSMGHPVPVVVSIKMYDFTSQVFHGSVAQCSPTNASEQDMSKISMEGEPRPIPRRLRSMVLT
jgi:hypothetical protein